jgi:hypothetical protein
MADEREGQDDARQSSSGGGLSRGNSLTSLPETEFDLQTNAIAPDTGVQVCPPEFVFHEMHDAIGGWEFPLAPIVSYFTVTFLGGIEIRVGPHVDAPHTGLILSQNDMFSVSEEVLGNDGRIYLRLADGSGWVFDDAALFPHDPSVVRCLYTLPVPAAPCIPPNPIAPTPEVQAQQTLITFQGKVIPPAPAAPPPLLPSGELLASTPLPVASTSPAGLLGEESTSSVLSAPPINWFRVAYLGGIQVRCAPSIEAPCTGVVLPQNETFPVCEEIPGADGRTYLRLCDGRGWVFDDTALMPHDPSVRRGHWLATNPGLPQQHYQPRVLGEVQVATLPLRQGRLRPQPRGKRGGKKLSKYRNAAQNAQPAV